MQQKRKSLIFTSGDTDKKTPEKVRTIKENAHKTRCIQALTAGVERVMGIEPTRPAWKAGVLPLNYTRTFDNVMNYSI